MLWLPINYINRCFHILKLALLCFDRVKTLLTLRWLRHIWRTCNCKRPILHNTLRCTCCLRTHYTINYLLTLFAGLPVDTLRVFLLATCYLCNCTMRLGKAHWRRLYIQPLLLSAGIKLSSTTLLDTMFIPNSSTLTVPTACNGFQTLLVPVATLPVLQQLVYCRLNTRYIYTYTLKIFGRMFTVLPVLVVRLSTRPVQRSGTPLFQPGLLFHCKTSVVSRLIVPALCRFYGHGFNTITLPLIRLNTIKIVNLRYTPGIVPLDFTPIITHKIGTPITVLATRLIS